MDSVVSIILSLIAALIFSLIAWYYKAVLQKWRLKHLSFLLGKSDKVKIVFPTFFCPVFLDDSVGKGAIIPKNIHLMPLAEGRAITEIAQAISVIKPKCEIVIQSSSEFDDDGTPFISIGGPSVNSVSGQIIEDHWHEFKLIYPEHFATYGGVTYKPEIEDGKLATDFGFAFQTKIPSGSRTIVFCGVWAIGTELSVKSYLNIFKEKDKKDIRRKIEEGKNILLISEGKVSRLWANQPTIIGWREL